MAKEKRTFVFNIDWRDVLMDYPAEVRHEVYDAIIEYAASGKLIDLKPLAGMAFAFIKKEMDYNAARYEDTVNKRSEAGKKGMAARYANQTDGDGGGESLTKPNKTNNVRSVITKPNKTNNVRSVITNLTNLTDNDNVYDNDNVVEVVGVAGETREPPDLMHQLIVELMGNETWQYDAQKALGRTMQEIRELLPAYETDCRAAGIMHTDRKDIMFHFCNWIRKKDQIRRKENDHANRQQTTTRADRRRDALDAQRRGIMEELAANRGYPAIIGNADGTGS